jgi:hypothetical protein
LNDPNGAQRFRGKIGGETARVKLGEGLPMMNVSSIAYEPKGDQIHLQTRAGPHFSPVPRFTCSNILMFRQYNDIFQASHPSHDIPPEEHSMTDKPYSRDWFLSPTAIILYLALLKVIIHLPVVQAYGYFRDELYYIACSDHLAWGYVDQPPLSLFILAGTRFLFGDSLLAIRIIPILAGAAVVVLTGFMARKMGGGRLAQVIAALAALTAPVILGNAGRYFSMNAFDLLFWALASYIAILILRGGSQKLWLLFGAVAGLGMMNKYSMAFFVVGLLIGMLLTPHRKQFLSRWFWIGGALGILIVLPHIVWEISNNFPTREFMSNATGRKNIAMGPWEFFVGQIGMEGPGNLVIWLWALAFFLFSRLGRTCRPFGIAYFVIFILLLIQHGKTYYLSPVYPVLFAGGAYGIESLAIRPAFRWLKSVIVALVAVSAVMFAPYAIPVLPVETFVTYQELTGVKPSQEERSRVGVLPQYYADMFGWPEMADSVARVYAGLPEHDQEQCMIYLRNYGEAAAIDFFGKSLGLPGAACPHNSYWYWKPRPWNGEVCIIFGSSNDTAECFKDFRQFFEDVQFVTTTHCEYAIPYESGRPIFICRRAKITLDQLWLRDRMFI